MKVPSLDSLLEDQLKDLYSAENQLLKALPKMMKAAGTPELQDAFEAHLQETKQQVTRLDKISKLLEVRLTGKKCKAMEGLIEEGKEVLEMEAEPAIIDAALIAAAQRVEHYEIAGYGNARALAQVLGHDQVAKLLTDTLEEEGDADTKLTEVCESFVFPAANAMDNDDEEAPTTRRRKMAMRG
jgi:ferritin-like metal-binding protein YciE